MNQRLIINYRERRGFGAAFGRNQENPRNNDK